MAKKIYAEMYSKMHLFGALEPDPKTLSFVIRLEGKNYVLVGTCATDDPRALGLHKQLGETHGQIFHYQMNAFRNAQPVGINLYFKKPDEL